jgi:aldehyde dehydrogenase (NAD+)
MHHYNQVYINGTWASAASIPVVNPATEDVFAAVPAGSADDIDKAVTAARARPARRRSGSTSTPRSRRSLPMSRSRALSLGGTERRGDDRAAAGRRGRRHRA